MNDITVNPAIFALALGLMAAGLALFFWGVRRRNLPYLRTSTPIVWALIAMGPALMLFSTFPDSTAEGTLGAFSLGGAFAAFALVWYLGTKLARDGIEADGEVEQLKAALATATAAAATAVSGSDDPAVRQRHAIRYRVSRRRGREVVIVTGELLSVRGVDVWASPENTNMQPSRYHERSISAMVRYYGATRDADGEPRVDVIGDELAAAMRERGKSVVPAGAVISTSPGALAASHGVKRLYHVAAVEGSPGGGYAPVAQIGRCVSRALERMDAPEEAAHGARSILFPMLGAGVAGGDRATIATDLLLSAAEYLDERADSQVERVYFLAHRRSELHHWVQTANACSLLEADSEPIEALAQL
jgi:O-acetyl-ADP-ribose deacetylase (regulator of RNase III)